MRGAGTERGRHLESVNLGRRRSLGVGVEI